MVVLGLILLIIGLVASIPVLTTIGAILLVVGLVVMKVFIGAATGPVPVSCSTVDASTMADPSAVATVSTAFPVCLPRSRIWQGPPEVA